MHNNPEIQYYSLKHILTTLGEQEQTGDLHIHFKQEIFKENPFPYPFRSNNNTLILLLRGKMKIRINWETYIVSENDMITYPSRSIFHMIEVSEPVQCVAVLFTDDFAIKNLVDRNDINVVHFLSKINTSVLSLSQEKRELVYRSIENLYRLNSGAAEPYRKERIMHYFNSLILEYMAFYLEGVAEVTIKTSRKRELVLEFLNQVHRNSRSERSVQFYADKLYVTPDYLTKVLKEVSSMTAREIIEEIVVMDARELLMGSSLTLGQIAEKLNFSDQSFFGKFFKKKMKLSPNAFRNHYDQ